MLSPICFVSTGTFGQKGGWPKLPDDLDPKMLGRMMPKDIQRVASAITLKVLNGGTMPKWKYVQNGIK